MSFRQLKLKARDGKFYSTDVVNESGLNMVIALIPSKKSEVFAHWMKNMEISLDEKSKQKVYELFESGFIDNIESERRRACSRSTGAFSADSMILPGKYGRLISRKAFLPLHPRCIWMERLHISKKCPKVRWNRLAKIC